MTLSFPIWYVMVYHSLRDTICDISTGVFGFLLRRVSVMTTLRVRAIQRSVHRCRRARDSVPLACVDLDLGVGGVTGRRRWDSFVIFHNDSVSWESGDTASMHRVRNDSASLVHQVELHPSVTMPPRRRRACGREGGRRAKAGRGAVLLQEAGRQA